jgi:hypothetical protein
VAEGAERPEDGAEGRADGDLEELRKEIQAEGGGEGTDGEGRGAVAEGEAAQAPQAEKDESPEQVSDDDTEEFRKQLLDDYGPDGLGTDDPAEREQEPGTDGRKGDYTEDAGDGGTTEKGASREEEASAHGGDAEGHATRSEVRTGAGVESGPAKEEPLSKEHDHDDASEKTEVVEASARPSQVKDLDPEELAQAGQEEPSKEASEPAHGFTSPPDAPRIEETPGVPKMEEAPAEAPAKIESYDRSDAQVLVAAKEAPDNHGREPGHVQSPDLHRSPADFEVKSYPESEAVNQNSVKAGESVTHANSPSVQRTRSSESSLTVAENSGTPSEVVFVQEGRGASSDKNDGGPLPTHTEGMVGRYNQNGSQLVVAEQERPESREQQRTERLETDDIIRNAAKYMESTALLIPESNIPEHMKNDVIEVRVAREKESWKEYTLYCRHTPGQAKAYLDLRQIGAEVGEEFKVKAVEVQRPESFVRGYNEKRPKGLENTGLLLEGNTLKIRVDEVAMSLEQPRFRSQQGNSILEARIAGEKAVKISKGLEGYTVRLGDHSQIVSMTRSEKFLTISYTRTGHDKHPHRSDVEIERSEPTKAHRIELGSMHLRTERFVDEQSGRIKVDFSAECQAIARTYWKEGRANSKQEGDYHIGDIGEAIARVVFRESGYSLLPRERFKVGTSVPKHDSANHGPDLLVTKEGYSVAYVKHWKNHAKAIDEAKNEVQGFRDSKKRIELEQSLGAVIRGGFAMELVWSYNQPSGIIYMEYEKFH